MNRFPCLRIFIPPSSQFDRLQKALRTVIRFKALKPLVLGILAHVLDYVGSYVVNPIDPVDLHVTSCPDRLQLTLFDEGEIADHVVVNRSTLLELDHSNVFEIWIPVLKPLNKLLEMLVTGFDIRYIESMLIIEGQGYELGTTIEIGANKLSDPVTAHPLTFPVILFIFLAGTIAFFFSKATSFGIKFLIPPYLGNPFRYNDLLIVGFQKNHPLPWVLIVTLFVLFAPYNQV